MHFLGTFIVALILGSGELERHFSEIEIEKAFVRYLTPHRLLMETSGAKIIRLPKGRTVVIAVASTAIKDDSAQDRLRAERVCRIKALANVVAERQGIQVAHAEQLNEKSVVIFDGDTEQGTSVSELLEITKASVEGVAKDMPVVGRWKSKQGDIFYLAIGAVLDKDGNSVGAKGTD
ncbi:MAG: hypothetical protein H6822_06495 [Planctomycetaceae bacterium]|nr:hypothetical protein [Planctomycetaceae bacterium]